MEGKAEEQMRSKILLFAGTTEGRKIAEVLNQARTEAYVSVATEYGKELLKGYTGIQILCGRMDRKEIQEFLKEKRISLVIDATHPFARAATENIREACKCAKVQYLRCVREKGETEILTEESLKAAEGLKPQVILVCSVADAVDNLKGTEGRILIATGSKELSLYTQIDGFRKRCFARVLPVWESVEKSIRLGFEGEHLIAMQGPFSREMNAAMLRHIGASYFVTKDSGRTGGFEEKLEAARETNATLVVVGRPEERGMSLEEIIRFLKKACIFPETGVR